MIKLSTLLLKPLCHAPASSSSRNTDTSNTHFSLTRPIQSALEACKFLFLHLHHLKPLDRNPRRGKESGAKRAAHARKNDRIPKIAVRIRDDLSADRAPRQRRQGRDGKDGTGPHADVADRADLRAQHGRQADAGAGADAKQRREQDDGRVARGGEP